MFSRSAGSGADVVFRTVILCFCFIPNFGFADWNSGVTIEDVSTRIAVDVVDDGVQVTVDLSEDAVAQVKAVNLVEFAKNAIKIAAKEPLIPIIKVEDDFAVNSGSGGESSGNSKTIVFFPFAEPRPEQLDIAPVFEVLKKTGSKYLITVLHYGLPVIDHGVLTAAETLKLDWQDPWYSHFINPKLQRGHSDPVMAFLYIEPQQIKSEIVVRVKEMSNWADLELRDNTLIYPDEFAIIKKKIGHYLLAQNYVSADAKSLTSILERVDYIRMGASDIQAYQPQQAQRQVATLIGVSIIHPIQQLPGKVQWRWNLFNSKIQRVAIRAYDPAGLFDSYVTPEYPDFEWENMLADIDLPQLSDQPVTSQVAVKNIHGILSFLGWPALIGGLVFILIVSIFIDPRFRKYIQFFTFLLAVSAGFYLMQIGELDFREDRENFAGEDAKPIIKQLLWNVYQAFESTQEGVAYDKLADSISGDLREQLYLQNRQMFLVPDGGFSKVKSIEIQNLIDHSSLFEQGFLLDCEWLITGEVIHWGHQHRRENLYRANIKVVPIEGFWKIVELESIDQQRKDGE